MGKTDKMLVRPTPDGDWEVAGMLWSGIVSGIDGALCRLRDYEKTGLQPGQILEMNELYLEKCREVTALKKKDRWIPVGQEEKKPPEEGYILLSFENCSLPEIGRYAGDENGGAFYAGDDEESCISMGLAVNAWRPLPEQYRKEDGGEKCRPENR